MTAIRTVRPVAEVAAEIGIRPEHLVPYGHDKAKVRLAALDGRSRGKLILVSALTPTSAGDREILARATAEAGRIAMNQQVRLDDLRSRLGQPQG